MSTATKQDWTKPAAMAIPEGGFDPDHVEQGRYGPDFPEDAGLLWILDHREADSWA